MDTTRNTPELPDNDDWLKEFLADKEAQEQTEQPVSRSAAMDLELEQIRFGDELSVVFDIEEDSFLLPVLSIQPLVENAVKHGIAKKRGGGIVTISSRKTEWAYEITISDTGVGFVVDGYLDDGKVHIGLENVRQRLRSIMNATVNVDSTPGNGTTVTVTIPKEKVSS